MTPATVSNPPNLTALAYRVGTHASFFESMLARLADYQLQLSDYERLINDPPGLPPVPPALTPLKKLTTRSLDDPSIALLDAWAMVADVLTFYEERIANEGYLPTATERRSIMELAALVGYALRPGVAASGYLAFTLQDGFDGEVPAGTRAQTLPGPGEAPQPFETSATLGARAQWNALQPRLTRPQRLAPVTTETIYLQGVATKLKANDPILLSFEDTDQREFRLVKTATPEPDFKRTKLELQPLPNGAAAAGMDAARRELRRHLRLPRSVSLRSRLAREVVEILRDALDRLNPGLSAAEVTGLLRRSMIAVRSRQQSTPKTRRTTELDRWIRAVIRDLDRVLDELAAARRAARPQPASRPPIPDFPAGLDSLYRLLDPLSKQPSIPPASPSALAPTVADIFSAGSDQQVEVLAALRPGAVSPYLAWANAKLTPDSSVTVYALRLTVQLFGHAAPKHFLPDGNRYVEWPIIEYLGDPSDPKTATQKHEAPRVLDLEGSHPQILPDSWIVVSTQNTPLTTVGKLIAKVTQVNPNLSRADYGISGPVTEITIDRGGWIDFGLEESEATISSSTDSDEETEEDFDAIRKTVVYAQPEKLELAEGPVTDHVQKKEIELGALYNGLQPGRWLIVAGDRQDIPDTTVPGAELVMLERVEQTFDKTLPGDRVVSKLHLANSLAFTYGRGTATVYGNVVAATHGETHREVLGSGDGSQASQRFTLRFPSLTYVAANNPKGTASTLLLMVDGVPWQETDSLTSAGPTDHLFTTRTSDDGKTTLTFGDGARGARLPSGSENVVAIYRTGLGKGGNAAAEQISLLATKPLGVKAVVNPIAAAAGADPEGRESGRRNAPLGVAPLDRLVSVADYQQFALGFGGVGKASAGRL